MYITVNVNKADVVNKAVNVNKTTNAFKTVNANWSTSMVDVGGQIAFEGCSNALFHSAGHPFGVQIRPFYYGQIVLGVIRPCRTQYSTLLESI